MSSDTIAASFGDIVGRRIQAERMALSMRWLEALTVRLPLGPNEVFPTAQLLDHIPEIVREIGAYLSSPAQEEISANSAVILKARELGQLRHEQRASVHQLLHEYELLGNILFAFIAEESDRLALELPAAVAFDMAQRVNRAVCALMQTTVDTFVSEYTSTIEQHTSRLQSFNQMLNHELRNPLGTIQFAAHLLEKEDGDPGTRVKLVAMIKRNIDRAVMITRSAGQIVFGNVADAPSHQEVELQSMAADVFRQLRDVANERGVELRRSGSLLSAIVDPGKLELVLLNLVSNAIKYSDPAKPQRFVEVGLDGAAGNEHTLIVRDNGLGIPEPAHDAVFQRFHRAHADRDAELGVDGLGMGLTIVQECVRELGGRVRLESQPGLGSTFYVTIPVRPAAG
jgi:signal transduction histidine kinase